MKKFRLFFLIFIFFSSFAYASTKVDLSEHGEDLMKAPFPARYQFYKSYRKDWVKSTYSQRKAFLTKWHLDQIQLDKEARAQAKQEARIARDKQRQKNAENRAQESKRRAQERKNKEEGRAARAQAKAFNRTVQANQRTLDHLMRQ